MDYQLAVLFNSKIRKKVELNEKALTHIKEHHPIMEQYLGYLKEILLNPDEVRYSVRSQRVLLFYRYFANIEGGKYIVVVVRVNKKNHVLTTYLTDKIKSGGKYEY